MVMDRIENVRECNEMKNVKKKTNEMMEHFFKIVENISFAK